MQLSSNSIRVAQRGLGGPCAQINRQAIFDRALNVLGYELACRFEAEGSEEGSSNLILDAFTELGLERVVGDRLVFLPVAPSVISDDLLIPIPPDRTVLQLDATALPRTDRFIEALRGRVAEGFQIAFDNLTLGEASDPLIGLARYVKADVAALQAAGAREVARSVHAFGARLIVKHVETYDEVRLCTEAGCDALQGSFLCRPKTVVARRAPRNVAVLAELLGRLKAPNVSFSDIEEIVRKDAGLSVTLLRLLNSSGFGLRVQVSTIRQAVAFLGLTELGKWATLMTLAADNDKPSELLIMALIRAKTCELVMRSVDKSNSGNLAFMAGLFSLLDALLDQPLEAVLTDLPIADTLRSALLENAGPEGELLAAVLDHERGLFPENARFPAATLAEAWRYSVEWVEGMRLALAS